MMSPFFKDLAERTAATFGFAFLSVFSFTDMSTLRDAGIAGAAAAGSVIKAWLKGYAAE